MSLVNQRLRFNLIKNGNALFGDEAGNDFTILQKGPFVCMQPSLFLSHGTPWLTIQENRYTEFLREYVACHEKPSAIVMISSLWSSSEQAVSAIRKHAVCCSFSCCPQEAYSITYPASGDFELSDRILTLLSRIGIFAELEEKRPLDYASWVPLQIMYPNADIPVVSLSINSNLSFKRQYEIGQALASLREENVLIIGSGGLVYNLEHIQYDMHVVEGWAIRFIEWMEEKINHWDLDSLFHFQQKAPYAYDSVPHIEEIIPLIIAMGAGDCSKNSNLLHRSFQFGNVSLSALEFK